MTEEALSFKHLPGFDVVGKKKRKSAAPLLGNHQKCWVWGKHAVMETLRAERWKPLEIQYDSIQLSEDVVQELRCLATRQNVRAVESTSQEMSRLSGTREHQGVMAKMSPYPYADAEATFRKLHPTSAVLVLAGIQDPFNFGSILRSADLFGFDAVFVPDSGQAPVSSHVARSSVGAVNYLEIVQVPDLVSTGERLTQQGMKLVAATEKGNSAPDRVDLRSGTAIVIGNEAAGIPPELLELCSQQVCIPISGHVDSLNAAVAAGILCYELRRQRTPSLHS